MATVQTTDQSFEDDNWVEVMWYFGYTWYSSSSTSNPAYQYNYMHNLQQSWGDISQITGKYPNWGDRINMTVRYDYTDGQGKHFYRIIIRNVDQPTHWIEVADIPAKTKGYRSNLQSETWNNANGLQGKQYLADYLDTSMVWRDWSSFTLIRAPSDAWNQLCVENVSPNNDQFKFGTIVSGACIKP